MRYFSTFSGIGGFELGIRQAYEIKNGRLGVQGKENVRVERARPEARHSAGKPAALPHRPDGRTDGEESASCVGYSEVDRFAKEIYSHHFPAHQNYGDITKIDAAALPDFDLLVGGFPCQAFSIAGNRRGFADTRGTLFFDLARILQAKRPRFFIFENVKGLLSHDGGRTIATIITTLTELGYDLQWQVLNSKDHGVPQSRERVFIVGHSRGVSRPEVFPFPYDAEVSGEPDGAGAAQPQTKPASTIRTKYGTRADDSYIIARNQRGEIREMDHSGSLTSSRSSTQFSYLVPEATQKGYAEAAPGDSINLQAIRSTTRRGRIGKGIAQTLDTTMAQHTLQGARIRRLTPVECERLQGFPDNWTRYGSAGAHKTTEISDTQRYKTLGNAVTVNVVRDIVARLIAHEDEEIASSSSKSVVE